MITDLEAAAIGEILMHQPCTSHFVRTCFRDSPSHHFSDSTGSVYPMMKRLEKRGLLNSSQQTDGKRQVRYYRCTKPGQAELRKWLGPPVAEDATLTVDPIRTRIIFLNRLSKTARVKWFEAVEIALRDKLASIKKQAASDENGGLDALLLKMANENAIQVLRCRLKWLKFARDQFEIEGHI